MSSLRIAVVGAGRFCTKRILSQLNRHDVEPVAICDLVEEKANAARLRFGFGKSYTDFRLMLEKESPDAVFCIGGPDVHYPVGCEVLKMGFPLYTQKPPTWTARDAAEMADLAGKAAVVFHVGFNLRSAPVSLKAKQIAATEEFGGPRAMIMRYGLAGNRSRMTVIDQHCHAFDLVRFMLGRLEVTNVTQADFDDSVNYFVTVKSETGAVGTICCTAGGMYNKEFLHFEVSGKQGLLYTHDFYSLEHLRPGDPTEVCDHIYRRGLYLLEDLEWLGYYEDVRNYFAAVRGEEPDRSPISEAVNSMEVTERVFEEIGEAG